MKATVLVDNEANEGLSGEWGLCVYISYQEKIILLDTGSSKLFLTNAQKLNKSIEKVDAAVLSHAHYDHANGMKAFFESNEKASFYLREGAGENCYHKRKIFRVYIGIPKGITKKYAERIKYASGLYRLYDGVYLLGHSAKGLEKIGQREHMYTKIRGRWAPDDFSHEQSLIFDTSDGLVIFNSCSHGGVINIIEETKAAFPDKKIKALIGGFHIFNKPEEEIRQLASKIRETGIESIYTGHCSKEKGYRILHEELGDMVKQFHAGLEIEFE